MNTTQQEPEVRNPKGAPLIKTGVCAGLPMHEGFRCPKCKATYFSTFDSEFMLKVPEKNPGSYKRMLTFGDKVYEPGDSIGYCNAKAHVGGECTFNWNRKDDSTAGIWAYYDPSTGLYHDKQGNEVEVVR